MLIEPTVHWCERINADELGEAVQSDRRFVPHRPTLMIAAFPHVAAPKVLEKLPKSDPLVGSIVQEYRKSDEQGFILSLICYGLMLPAGRTWWIINTQEPQRAVAIPHNADLFLFSEGCPLDLATERLQAEMQARPPSQL